MMAVSKMETFHHDEAHHLFRELAWVCCRPLTLVVEGVVVIYYSTSKYLGK